MNNIQVTVVYTNGSTRNFIGTRFQQGDRAISITTPQGSVIGIPNDKVDVYEIQQIQTEEQAGDASVEPEVQTEDSAVEEEGDTTEEEAS